MGAELNLAARAEITAQYAREEKQAETIDRYLNSLKDEASLTGTARTY